MITITEQVAIQGNTALSNFNNTIYPLGYADTLYDKPYNTSKVVDYLIAYRQRYNVETNTRIEQSHFTYVGIVDKNPRSSKILRWEHPELMMQLRQGKNAITYKWQMNAGDDHEYNWINQYTRQWVTLSFAETKV